MKNAPAIRVCPGVAAWSIVRRPVPLVRLFARLTAVAVVRHAGSDALRSRKCRD